MEKVDLEFLARQLDRLIDDVVDLRDDMAVLSARLERMEATSNVLLAQTRAMHNRHERLAARAERADDQEHHRSM
jgi:cell division protein FtsB